MSLSLNSTKSAADLAKQGVTAALDPGVEFEGKLKISSGTVRINSHFKGEISGEGALVIAERGEVEAEIAVKSVTVLGKVKGSVHASDRLEIRERGVILGDIHTPVLLVEPGGYFDGQCHMPTQVSEGSKAGAEQEGKEHSA
ncbi:MAG: bactofilin family protein [Terriglobia bacterium]